MAAELRYVLAMMRPAAPDLGREERPRRQEVRPRSEAAEIPAREGRRQWVAAAMLAVVRRAAVLETQELVAARQREEAVQGPEAVVTRALAGATGAVGVGRLFDRPS